MTHYQLQALYELLAEQQRELVSLRETIEYLRQQAQGNAAKDVGDGRAVSTRSRDGSDGG